MDEEDYILPALKSRDNAVEVVLVVYFLLIHFQDNIAAVQPDVIGE